MQVIKSNTNSKIINLAREEDWSSRNQNANELILFNHAQITCSVNSKLHVVFIKNISHLRAESNYTTIYFKDSTFILTSKTLKFWEGEINSNYFFRSHSSTLVNRFEVSSIDSSLSTIELKNGSIVPMSRRLKHEVKKQF